MYTVQYKTAWGDDCDLKWIRKKINHLVNMEFRTLNPILWLRYWNKVPKRITSQVHQSALTHSQHFSGVLIRIPIICTVVNRYTPKYIFFSHFYFVYTFSHGFSRIFTKRPWANFLNFGQRPSSDQHCSVQSWYNIRNHFASIILYIIVDGLGVL